MGINDQGYIVGITLDSSTMKEGYSLPPMSLLADPDHVRLSSPEVLEELKTVDASWRFDCIDDVSFERIDGMSVLRRHESDFHP